MLKEIRGMFSISFHYLRLTIESFTDMIFPSYMLTGMPSLSTLLSPFCAQILTPFITLMPYVILEVTENCVHLRKLIWYLVHMTIYARPVKYLFFPVLIPATSQHYLVRANTICLELFESILMTFWGTKKTCIMERASMTHLKKAFFQKWGFSPWGISQQVLN